MNRIKGIAPIFLVADVVKTAEYYKDVLGFSYDKIWGHPPEFCMPKRDGIIVMLSAARNPERIAPNNKAEGVPESWDAYFWIEDADELFTEFKHNNALVMYEPIIRDYYDMKEFAVRDLDGYALAFGQNLNA